MNGVLEASEKSNAAPAVLEYRFSKNLLLGEKLYQVTVAAKGQTFSVTKSLSFLHANTPTAKLQDMQFEAEQRRVESTKNPKRGRSKEKRGGGFEKRSSGKRGYSSSPGAGQAQGQGGKKHKAPADRDHEKQNQQGHSFNDKDRFGTNKHGEKPGGSGSSANAGQNSNYKGKNFIKDFVPAWKGESSK